VLGLVERTVMAMDKDLNPMTTLADTRGMGMKAILGAQLRRAALVVAGLVASLTVSAAETFEYIHTDALGSPVAVTDANGVVIERMVYEPYGAVVGGPVKDGPGYTGHVADSETGLSYMQQRYFDPELGVLLSVDPITTLQVPIGAFNRYTYADRSPYGYVDPDGRQSVDPRAPEPPPTPLPKVTVTAPKFVSGPQPSFFTLTTVTALRRDTSISQAVRSGELARTVTLPALTVTASPPASALAISTAPVVVDGAVVAGTVVLKSKTSRETLYYVCIGVGMCNGERAPLHRNLQQERNAQVRDGAVREAKAKVWEIPNP